MMKSKNKNKKVSFYEPSINKNTEENEKHEFSETLFENEDDNDINGHSNDISEEDMSYMLKNFNPLDFGIKDKLTESEKKIIIREIFGITCANTSSEYNEDDKNEEKNENVKIKKVRNNIIVKDFTSGDNIQNDINDDKIGGKKKKKKKKKNNDNFSYLDGDCYFPNDGYDYEQHLKPISNNFVEIKTKSENKIFEIKPIDEEEKELFKTFEADNYEELNDNFVYEAQNVEAIEKLHVDNKLIWGNPESFLFISNNNICSTQIGDDDCEEVISDFENDNYDAFDKSEKNIENTNAIVHDNNSTRYIQSDEDNDKGLSCENAKNFKTITFDEKMNYGIENKIKREKNDDSIKLSDLINLELKKVNASANDNTNEIKRIMKKNKKIKNKNTQNIENIVININDNDKEKILKIVDIQNDEIVVNPDISSSYFSDDDSFSYDCQTILTTKTNTTNHPSKLIIPKNLKFNQILNKKTFNTNFETKEKPNDTVNKLERYLILDQIKTKRDKNETPEEKRERKKSVKEAQRLNRKLKKENSLIMKNEKKLMNKNVNPFDIRDNVKYIKL
ncbi:conserved Plasmodium protein, unknown function [Plasmodium berghei]|uniref:Protein LTV1 homolog n=2 Tax=Plasmodium berghei TaxID=5821 RepID=A0A509AH79_PLABA|nr:conserved protein, unknown function [Plasmodium berghei ANKA]CXH95544.1 conserved Plasmodium protein, unknown function [Plasmodium berghei]VUC54150.1 conserved protein, unknown function [Plasmodium berghei ANKA]|eukprot:XP_034419995.1 conserved protein, unknown function [Plasmodium berghei ANKA]